MATITNILQNVWKRNYDFCCLCFRGLSEELTLIEDEIYTSFSDSDKYVPMSEILCTVLGYDILDYVSSFKHICRTCTQASVNSYTFIKTCKLNSERLANGVNSLLNTVENIDDDIVNCNTVFVSMNTEDFTSQSYYDLKKPITNFSMARRRYNALLQSLKKQKCELGISKNESVQDKTIKLIDKCGVLLRTNDMIKCKECHKAYTTEHALKNHYIRTHAKMLFKCTECNKNFRSPSCLEAHTNNKHCTFICSDCGKTFKSKSTFKTHERSHYLRIVCPDCGRVYKNKATYKKHIELNVCGQKTRASPANAKFTCDYCNKKYTQKVSLRVHIQYEHGNYKYHVCEICNKKFWAHSRLKAHMVKHTKERNFVCSLCNGKFVTKEALLYHTRIHTGEKPYECPNCDARFLSASRRSEHLKRHHTNATLECDICGCKFNSQNY